MRSLTRILLLLVICWAATWGLASALAPPVIDRLLTSSLPQNRGDRLAVDHLTYDRVRVSPSLLGLSFEGISAAFDLEPSAEIRLDGVVELHTELIAFRQVILVQFHACGGFADQPEESVSVSIEHLEPGRW